MQIQPQDSPKSRPTNGLSLTRMSVNQSRHSATAIFGPNPIRFRPCKIVICLRLRQDSPQKCSLMRTCQTSETSKTRYNIYQGNLASTKEYCSDCYCYEYRYGKSHQQVSVARLWVASTRSPAQTFHSHSPRARVDPIIPAYGPNMNRSNAKPGFRTFPRGLLMLVEGIVMISHYFSGLFFPTWWCWSQNFYQRLKIHPSSLPPSLLSLLSLLPCFLPSFLTAGPQQRAPDVTGHCQASTGPHP